MGNPFLVSCHGVDWKREDSHYRVIASDATLMCVRVYRQFISRELPHVCEVDDKRGFPRDDGSFWCRRSGPLLGDR